MALQEWQLDDTARQMTKKFNQTVKVVNTLYDSRNQVPEGTKKELERLQSEINSKPDKVTKEDVGLGEVDNTSDMDKPVSTAQQKAINEAVNNVTRDSIYASPITESEYKQWIGESE